nr:hypothetical protein [Chloroflexota bacterium]
MTRLAAAILALAGMTVIASAGAAPVRAADPVFGEPTIDATFGQGVELTQPVTLDETPGRVEVLLTYADPDRALVVELPV